MRKKQAAIIVFSFFIIFWVVFQVGNSLNQSTKVNSPAPYIGVDAAYGGVNDVKMLVDEVKSYTNVFIVGSTEITMNLTQLQDVSQYIIDKGLYLVIFTHFEMGSSLAQWINNATQTWGNKFLGVYAYDELGGRQLDHAENYTQVNRATNYSDASAQFVSTLNKGLNHFMQYYMMTSNQNLITSDYALYWFDYKAGYNTVLSEFIWNYSKQLSISLNRGAATVQNKNWGVIIDWTYDQSPYIESGPELYNDMILAYQSGAKYITIFDYPKNSTYGILQKEHLQAIQQFWQYAKNNPQPSSVVRDRIAYVLPKDYGYGFRGPNDYIWGLWSADNLTYQIATDVGNALVKYEGKLDVIYDDGLDAANTGMYSHLIFWNGTIRSSLK
jgi:hypothetical protein